MSRAELKKVVVMEKIISGHMTNAEGAAALGLTDRQIIRLKKRYLTEGGAAALAHRNRGRKPAHALTDETKERVGLRGAAGCDLQLRQGVSMNLSAAVACIPASAAAFCTFADDEFSDLPRWTAFVLDCELRDVRRIIHNVYRATDEG